MYIYFKNADTEGGVSLGTIQISIAFALIHGVLEVLIIWIEAKVFEQPFFEYFVICFNGRLGWVPKLNRFYDKYFVGALSRGETELNYDKIEKKICGMDMSVEFLFSN